MPSRQQVLAVLGSVVWRYRRRVAAALGLLLLSRIANLAVPWAFKAIIDLFSQEAARSGAAAAERVDAAVYVLVVPVALLIGYSVLRFSSSLFVELRDLTFSRVTNRTIADSATQALRRLMELGSRFHSRHDTGALMYRVDRGSAAFGFMLSAALFTFIPALVEVIGVLVILMAGYSLWFALIIALTLTVYAGYTIVMTERRVALQRQVIDVGARAESRMLDSLLNYVAVKSFAREAHEAGRYASLRDEWVEYSERSQRALSSLHIGQAAIIAGGVAAVMVLAGQEVARGAMTVGDLVLVNAYVIQICLPLNSIGFVFRQTRDAIIDAEHLCELMDQAPDSTASAPEQRGAPIEPSFVAFEDVSFSYDPGRPVLSEISFRIPSGQTLAVVGSSGSGKSTIARLLLRFYDIDKGRILIGGTDIRAVPASALREHIGVVPQETALFNDTIAYNIGYGRAGATIAEIVEAAKAAQVHEFVSALPQQCDTVVGERGLKLSGGERQRIAIARLLLKNPPIVIFDEATSALDTRAERAIQQELERISKGRTTLIIAHRLSTIVDADEIVVLDRGRIVERGRHDALLAAEGLYSQLWNLQRQQQEFERTERRLARRPLNLAAVLADVMDGLRGAIDARGVQIYTSIDLENARILGDPTVLSQALWELLQHALTVTPAGERIEISLDRSEGQASLTLTDGRHRTGRHRASSESAEAAHIESVPPIDPMALRSTIERQGGSFVVEPATAAHGMRFKIHLPLQALDTLPAPRPDTSVGAPAATSLSGRTIMVIEDDENSRQMLGELLNEAGARVLAFGSGEEALDALNGADHAQWPDLLLCDIGLPGEDGYSVIRRLRQTEVQRGVALEQRLPAVALTGHAAAADRVRALMAGFQMHLAKPVAPQELFATIGQLAHVGGAPGPVPVRPGSAASPAAGHPTSHGERR